MHFEVVFTNCYMDVILQNITMLKGGGGRGVVCECLIFRLREQNLELTWNVYNLSIYADHELQRYIYTACSHTYHIYH